MGHPDDGHLDAAYLLAGERLKARIVEFLGEEWTWKSRRVLDFGCGSGRLLRHWLEEARVAEFHGADISDDMISWVDANLCPPIAGAQTCDLQPPLSFPSDHFDLVTALSVFTHIAEGWSEWLLELQRVLKPGGVLIATFLDSACGDSVAPLRWDEERVGMSAFGFADPDSPWANVLHSHWWLREHWGRAFEITHLVPGDLARDEDGVYRAGTTQGWIVLRPRDVRLTPEELERENPDDRYVLSHRYQLELMRAEGERLRERFRPRWPFGRGYRAALRLRRRT